jgi:putative oxidoreductase
VSARFEAARRRASDVGLLVLRLGGFAMISTFHVRPKIVRFDEELASFPDPLGIGHGPSFVLALASEGLCAALVAAGFLTRLAVLPILFTMAMVLVLGARGFSGADVQGALLYALPYAALGLLGPGAYSVDAVLSSRYEAALKPLLSLAGRPS